MPTKPPTRPIERIAADMLTTAVEGGSGYWSCVSDFERAEDLILSATIHQEANDDDDVDVIDGYREVGTFGYVPSGLYKAEGVAVTYADIVSAIRKIAHDPIKDVYEGTVALFVAIIEDPADADHDVEVADVALQVAVLGEVMY